MSFEIWGLGLRGLRAECFGAFCAIGMCVCTYIYMCIYIYIGVVRNTNGHISLCIRSACSQTTNTKPHQTTYKTEFLGFKV